MITPIRFGTTVLISTAMLNNRFEYLVDRYHNGELTPQEWGELYAILKDEQFMSSLSDNMKDTFLTKLVAGEKDDELNLQMWNRIDAAIQPAIMPQAHRARFLKTAWFRYAAAIIIVFGIGAYLWFIQQDRSRGVATRQPISAENDIAPGHDGAILTLADGTKKVLDSLGNGIVADQNGSRVILKDGRLAYTFTGKLSGNAVYNTMSTPKGRQFQLQLPDGTHVWLNAASSITYPTAFSEKAREVSVTGEVYFEVAKRDKQPFIVKVNEQTRIEVLGTHFNVNAYASEPAIRTTLLEGSVRVTAYDQLQTLKPGQQAKVDPHEKIKIVDDADINQVMAWKNGLFNFNGYDLKAVMREIGRWYDLEIVYEAEPAAGEVEGEIQRNFSLSQVMKVLQKINVHYRLEGKKLTIME